MSLIDYSNSQIDSVCQIDFDDRLMNGIEDIRSELSSWEWIFGKTPKFSLKHQKMADQWYECTINVQHGRIVSVTIVQIRDLSPVDQIPDLTGLPLMESPIESALESWFQRDPSIRALFIKQLIQETTASAFF